MSEKELNKAQGNIPYIGKDLDGDGIIDTIPVQLSGSIAEKQENWLSKAMKESYHRRIDEIVDYVGLDKMFMFLTWQDERPWNDLINPNLKFDSHFSGRYTTAEGGILGYYAYPETPPFNNNLEIRPHKLYEGTGNTPTYHSRVATKITDVGSTLGMILAKIKREGTIDGQYTIRLYADNNGKPADNPIRPMKFFVDERQCALLNNAPSDYEEVRIPLLHSFTITRGEDYWLVLEYLDDTNIDGDNYVQWEYGEVEGGKRAYWDGSEWVVVEGESHYCGLYSEDVIWPEEFTVLMPIKVDLNAHQRTLLWLNGLDEDGEVSSGVFRLRLRYGYLYGRVYLGEVYGTAFFTSKPIQTSNWTVVGLTFSQYDNYKKMGIYANGKLINPSGYVQRQYKPFRMGPGGKTLSRAGDLTIGASMSYLRTMYDQYRGNVGPLLITKKAYSEKEVAELSRLMMLNYPGGVN